MAQFENCSAELSRSALIELRARAEALERQRCAEDAEYWLFRYAKTKDEHDPGIEAEAKPFPADEPYLRELVRFWIGGERNIVEKSRQMLVTWTFCALYLWDTQFKASRLNFFVSKKETDSDRLVQRAYTLWANQPEFLKRAFTVEYSYCHLKFFKPGQEGGLPRSEIYGTASGPDVLRQHVASGIFIDEGAFQENLEGTIGAAQPAVKGGGRIDVVSSAEVGYFQELVEDKIK